MTFQVGNSVANIMSHSANTLNPAVITGTGSQIMHFDTTSQKSGESTHSMRSNSQALGSKMEASYEVPSTPTLTIHPTSTTAVPSGIGFTSR